ncbi:Uncharacterized protein APZ42_020042 [Daphnia magna]|uniref:Uncharacterized protein n=1 Tax=Daphnia magna TaxID=35525 RepID=A0A164XWX4_9CRUS|nr:Uncharacterized protein APZ42_020042 [Daphnia magna]
MSIAFYNRPLSSSKQFTYSGHTGQSSSGKDIARLHGPRLPGGFKRISVSSRW